MQMGAKRQTRNLFYALSCTQEKYKDKAGWAIRMRYDNDAKQLKHRVLSSVARLCYEDQLSAHIGEIPYDIIPGPQPAFRCCIYREREIIRERVTAACGDDLPNQEAGQIVGVLPAACEGCPINRFNVTDNCQKCLAKKCVSACPFGAVSVTGRGAYIDPAKCKECGRCAAACPYNAISDTMRPCLRSCPVNAITMDENRLAAIDYNRCISCGACTAGCPFGAITDRSSIVPVIQAIQSPTKVYAIFAPAIEGHFGTANVGMLKEGFKQLGFTGAVEVSLGADATAYHEAQEVKEIVESGEKMTTSCCPAFVDMIEKHFPKLAPNISHTASPMTMTVRYLKEKEPDCKVVFFGPCVAKKLEIKKAEDSADYVLTFEELASLFDAKQIDVEALQAENEQDGSIKGKNFAVSGGVTEAVVAALAEDGFEHPVSVVKCSGAKECKKQLMIMNAGRMKEDMIEGMACEGGCVAGPGGVETAQKLMKNRQKLLSAADKRGIKENLQELHDFSGIKMEQRA